MNEINIQLNPQQLALFKAARTEFAADTREIQNVRQKMKDDITSLLDNLKLDKKEHKQQIKAIKKSFVLFAKQSADEEKSLMDEAAELASI